MKNYFFNSCLLLLITFLFYSCSDSSGPTGNPDDQYRDEDYVYNPDDYYYTAEPLDWENYYYAEFGLHLPDDIQNMKGILVLVPGHNGNGLYLKDDPGWISFAEENNLALVGCYFNGNHYDKRYYLAGGGAGYALVTALDYFATETGLPELNTLPIAIRGYSDGAIFAYTFTCNIPQRIACFVSIKGGYFPFMADEVAVKTPGMFIYGELDLDERNLESKSVFFNYRKENDAQWILIEQKNIGHEPGNENDIVRPFLAKVCSLRINKNSDQLITLENNSGYLGSQSFEEYWSYSDYPNDPDFASWLPDEEFAIIWKNYVRGF